MKFTFYGHACFSVMINGKNILFDPFITPNELAANINVDEVPADFIFVSHGHGDHVADAVSIAKRTGAKLVSNAEVVGWFNKQGIENTHPMNTGGVWDFDSFQVKMVVAQHSSSMPDGSYGGSPVGFVFVSDEGNFYYSGDTSLTMDMQLIPRFTALDFAVLPIGDNFTMGADDAIEAAKWVNAKNVVGVHYDTFGYIKIDHDKTMKKFVDAGIQLQLVAIGSTIDV